MKKRPMSRTVMIVRGLTVSIAPRMNLKYSQIIIAKFRFNMKIRVDTALAEIDLKMTRSHL